MRLIHGHRMLGLAGMKSESEIPECRGMHGVYESGGLDKFLTNSPRPHHSRLAVPTVLSLKNSCISPPLEIESGGIRLYRPLLGFSKARLVATCKAESMVWFEDHTNQDPKVTTRNAIRSMLRSHELPAALNTASMARLSNRAQARRRMLASIADGSLQDKGIGGFETRAGTLRIQFPSLSGHRFKSVLPGERGLVAALLLRQVIMFVTPDEHVQLSSLHSAVQRLFPEINEELEIPPSPFTVSGLQFQPLPSVSPGDGKQEWFIYRQNHHSSFSRRPVIHIPPFGDSLIQNRWSAWVLYDGRFWIRIQDLGKTPVFIRPFQREDIVRLKMEVGREARKTLEALLKRFAPGNSRWTLPAIAMRDAAGKERVLALPTLNFSFPYLGTCVRWEIRYKKVDIGKLLSLC